MIFDKTGSMAVGSRLRMLSERITEEAKNIYELYEVPLKPKWFPVFYLLSQNPQLSITEIAHEIGHSHPSVSNIVREMVKRGIVQEHKDELDGRRNLIALTAKGKEISKNMTDQYSDVDHAVNELLHETTHNIWKAMDEMEFLLNQNSLLHRVKQQKRIRETKKIKIIPYEPKYRDFFKNLNQQWIDTYFTMEAADHLALDHPQEYIIDKGGYILVALYEQQPVGVCALLKATDKEYDFELAKMAVDPKFQGLGIGLILGQAIVHTARSLGGKVLYLESNTKLAPAIKLYQKLGFEKVNGSPSPYARCNIQMKMML